jgi:hypothetical protein
MLTEEHAVMSWRRVKVPVVHYLERRTFGCHAIHILRSVNTLVILLVLLQRKNKFVFSSLLYYKNVLHLNIFFLSVNGDGWF